MSLPTSSPLPIARYCFTARVHDALLLPQYAGSLLRGQFGAALRHLACMTRQPSCHGCPLRSTCPYPRIFEAPPPPEHQLQRFSAIPSAYVIEPPAPAFGAREAQHSQRQLQSGQAWQFHMVLTGQALEQLPLIIIAWQRALARGLGKSRSRLELLEVHWLDQQGELHPVWSEERPHIQPHAASLRVAPPPPENDTVQLRIHTPLRLQHQGKPLRPEQLTPRALISALARRIALLLEFHAGDTQWGTQVPSAAALAEQVQDARQLRWFDWTRYSSRQQQEMQLGGVLGQWTLCLDRAALAQLWPWLYLGQWLHVGKNASFGMGGYRLAQTSDAAT